MSAPTADPPAAETVLRAGLRARHGVRARAVHGGGGALDTFSSHPISRLRVELEGGGELPVVFKRLRPQPGKRAEREVLVYRRLLARHDLGAPTLYASACEPARGHWWLFLEDVGERRLDWLAAPGWEGAFRALARMHARWWERAHELRSLRCLIEHDAAFARGLATRARASVGARGTADARRRLAALMATGLDPAIAELARRPRTLLHGDFSCHNVMVARDGTVRPVDWEWAAVGPAGWDVAKLLAGWGRRKPRLRDSYLDELERRRAGPVDRVAFARELELCGALHALWYLRWWVEGCDEPEFVDRLLDKIATAWRA